MNHHRHRALADDSDAYALSIVQHGQSTGIRVWPHIWASPHVQSVSRQKVSGSFRQISTSGGDVGEVEIDGDREGVKGGSEGGDIDDGASVFDEGDKDGASLVGDEVDVGDSTGDRLGEREGNLEVVGVPVGDREEGAVVSGGAEGDRVCLGASGLVVGDWET